MVKSDYNCRFSRCQLAYSFVLVIAIIACISYFHFVGLVFPVDDAYIVTHNVKVFHNGGLDHNFQGSSVLSGTTSIVHFFIICLISLFVKPLMAQYIVAWLAVALYAIGLTKLAFMHKLTNTQVLLSHISHPYTVLCSHFWGGYFFFSKLK